MKKLYTTHKIYPKNRPCLAFVLECELDIEGMSILNMTHGPIILNICAK
jgi:hypothetical protein